MSGKYALKFSSDDPKSVSRTEQSHKGACDLNSIIARAEKTGLWPVAQTRAFFGDFTSTDFQDAQVKIAKAKQAFMSLPVSIRSRFGNDPAALLEFIDNKDNLAEARKLKLLPEATAEEKAAEAAAEAEAAGKAAASTAAASSAAGA